MLTECLPAFSHHVDLLWLDLDGSSENYMMKGQSINVLEQYGI